MSDNSKPTSKEGRQTSVFEYILAFVGLSILAVFLVIGMVLYYAIQGNNIAIGIVIGLGVIVVFFLGGVMAWATMAVNQKQDERAANQQYKITQLMMQQQQLAAGQGWIEQMKALAEGHKMSTQRERATQEQEKTRRLFVTKPEIDESPLLDISELEVDL
jgi:TM2 domain-containing membrane protein YozV